MAYVNSFVAQQAIMMPVNLPGWLLPIVTELSLSKEGQASAKKWLSPDAWLMRWLVR